MNNQKRPGLDQGAFGVKKAPKEIFWEVKELNKLR
jgi:hypothetical protein